MDWLYSAADLEQAVLKTGFLPFFQSDIPEFSIEEFTPAEYWFADGVDGPWEWKSPVAGFPQTPLPGFQPCRCMGAS
ncbi:AlkZ-related protein [Parabacteroides sp.]